MAGPEGDRLIRVDMTTQTISLDPFPEEWKIFGGRGLSAKRPTTNVAGLGAAGGPSSRGHPARPSRRACCAEPTANYTID